MNDIFKNMQAKVGCEYISDLPSYKRKVWQEMKRLNPANYEERQLSQQVQQMQEEEKNNEGKVSTEYVAPKQDVQNISVEVTPEMYLLDGASVLVLITASVLVSGIVILKRNPKDILSEMS